jgi:hypothetical protein
MSGSDSSDPGRSLWPDCVAVFLLSAVEMDNCDPGNGIARRRPSRPATGQRALSDRIRLIR